MNNIKYSNFDNKKCKVLLNFFKSDPELKEFSLIENKKLYHEMVGYYLEEHFNYIQYSIDVSELVTSLRQKYTKWNSNKESFKKI